MPIPFSGGCACGAIRYECHAEPLIMFNCHCRDCQRASGTAYAAVVMVPSSALRLLSGEPRWFATHIEGGHAMERSFCPQCGTPLFGQRSVRPEMLGIRVGSLDDPSWFAPTVDFWTSSAQPWDHMNPALRKDPRQPAPPQRVS